MAEDMNWTTERPSKPGFYWYFGNLNIRMVKVWKYSNGDPRLFTNEDGGASVSDEMYDKGQWHGPIEPPLPPKEK